MIIGMTIGIGIIGGGVGVAVEKDMVVTGTEKGIIAVVAGVPATVLMFTKSVGETGINIRKSMCALEISILLFHLPGSH